jgi:hypothetical protein
MTSDDLDQYIRERGYLVDKVIGKDGQQYSVVKDFHIINGSLKGSVCNLGFLRPNTVPYLFPAAIHTFPALVEMNSGVPLCTQPSLLADGWQYWSRRFDRAPTPKSVWAHIQTIFGEV